MDADQLRRWVTESRAAQGLPPTITDPDVLRRVAVILDAGPARKAS